MGQLPHAPNACHDPTRAAATDVSGLRGCLEDPREEARPARSPASRR
jgi:hypothetical protein